MAFSQGTGLGPVIGVVALLVVVGLLVSIGRSTSRGLPAGRRPDHRRCRRQPARPPVPGAGLAARRRRRLHRRAVVADLQRRRHRRHRRRRAAAPQHAVPAPAGTDRCRPPATGRSRRRRSPTATPVDEHDAGRAMIGEQVPSALAGERLDRIVALLADVSRSAAAAAIAAGGVRVDGEVAAVGQGPPRRGRAGRGRPGDVPDRSSMPTGDPDVVFGVVHVDDDVIVVDKPPGLVVHPGAGNPDGTLVNGLLHRFPELAGVGEPIRPGHRPPPRRRQLGPARRRPQRRTASQGLIGQFAAHTAGRRYDAVVWGHPDAPHGIIDAPIGRDPSDPLQMAVVVDGKPARTEYQVLEPLRRAGRAGPAAVPAGDGAHPPDPRPPRGRRPPAGRRPGLRRPPHDARADPPVPPRRRAVVRPPGDRGAADVHQPAARPTWPRSWPPSSRLTAAER